MIRRALPSESLFADFAVDETVEPGDAAAIFAVRALRAISVAAACNGALALIVSRSRRSTFVLGNVAASGCLALLSYALPFLRSSRSDGVAPPRTLPALDGGDLELSIIVPVLNRPEHIRSLLERLRELYSGNALLERAEILIVDDGSHDDARRATMAACLDSSLAARSIYQANAGPSAARNFGAANARGSIIVFLDSDCLPEPGWLEGLVAGVRSEPRTIAFARLRVDDDVLYPLENIPDRRGMITASFAIERDDFSSIGGFDPDFNRPTMDDHHFVTQAAIRRFRIGHVRAAWVAHPKRDETILSVWKAGTEARFHNLYAKKNGRAAIGRLGASPYFGFGIFGSHTTGLLCIALLANAAVATSAGLLGDRETCEDAIVTDATLLELYVIGLFVFAILKRVPARTVPRYVAALAAMHGSTFIGRLAGSARHGISIF